MVTIYNDKQFYFIGWQTVKDGCKSLVLRDVAFEKGPDIV